MYLFIKQIHDIVFSNCIIDGFEEIVNLTKKAKKEVSNLKKHTIIAVLRLMQNRRKKRYHFRETNDLSRFEERNVSGKIFLNFFRRKNRYQKLIFS